MNKFFCAILLIYVNFIYLIKVFQHENLYHNLSILI